MSNETNQDRQPPTHDQPPPEQQATERTGQPGERGTDERRPQLPDDVETDTTAHQGGQASGAGMGDKSPSSPGTKGAPKQGGQGGRPGESGSSGSTGGRGGPSTGSGSGNPSGGSKP